MPDTASNIANMRDLWRMQKIYIMEQRLKDMEQQNRQLLLEEGEISEPCRSMPDAAPGAAAAAADITTDARTVTRRCSWEDDE